MKKRDGVNLPDSKTSGTLLLHEPFLSNGVGGSLCSLIFPWFATSEHFLIEYHKSTCVLIRSNVAFIKGILKKNV